MKFLNKKMLACRALMTFFLLLMLAGSAVSDTIHSSEPLYSGQQVSGMVGYHTWRNYRITSSASDTQLKVYMTNLSADVDLYVRRDYSPTLDSYECRPYSGGISPETCVLPNNGDTTWYISVYGYQSGSFDIKAVLSNESADSFPDSSQIDNFVENKDGECVDTDGLYGCQCVDLMHSYISEVLGIPLNAQWNLHGHAYQIFSNIDQFVLLSSGSRVVRLEKILNTPSAIPSKGDIIFWNSNIDGEFGHVAIFLDGNVNSFYSIDQNWPYGDRYIGSPAMITNHSYRNVAGWLHPVLVSY